ncbi:MAG: DUF5684 domain-containing protein [Microbacterium sp.]
MNTDASTTTALILLGSIGVVVLYVWTALALGAVFRKSGEEAWKAWVPFYNEAVLFQLGGYSGWLVLLYLIPGLGALAVWVVRILACHRVGAAFGFGVGMTFAAALVLPIWASIIGFGPSRWVGLDRGPRRGVSEHTPPLPPRPPAPETLGLAATARPAPPIASPSVASPSVATPPPPPSFARPAAPAAPAAGAGWAPQMRTPAPDPDDWEGFALGAAAELTGEVTGAVTGAPAPISAVPAPPPAPARPATPPPVTRVPVSPPADPAAQPAMAREPWAPARSPMPESDAFAETSGPVSAIVGAPDAGAPRSARSSVSAQNRRPEIPEEPLEETVVARRRRTQWSLVPPSGEAVAIGSEVVLLGRRPAHDPEFPGAQLISIDDETVSKTHARLELRDDAWYVTDLGSTNGIVLSTQLGTEVEATPGVEVEAGERFLLGDAQIRLVRSAE